MCYLNWKHQETITGKLLRIATSSIGKATMVNAKDAVMFVHMAELHVCHQPTSSGSEEGK